MQKFRGFFKLRNFFPAKISDIKVTYAFINSLTVGDRYIGHLIEPDKIILKIFLKGSSAVNVLKYAIDYALLLIYDDQTKGRT